MAELSPGGYTTSNQASPLRRFSRPPSKLSKSSQQSVGNHGEGLLHCQVFGDASFDVAPLLTK